MFHGSIDLLKYFVHFCRYEEVGKLVICSRKLYALLERPEQSFWARFFCGHPPDPSSTDILWAIYLASKLKFAGSTAQFAATLSISPFFENDSGLRFFPQLFL